MKLDYSQVVERVSRFVAERLVAASTTPLGKFKLGFILPSIPTMLAPHWATAKDLGIVEEDALDTDRLRVCLESGMKEAGELTMLGFKFTPEDAHEFVKFLEA